MIDRSDLNFIIILAYDFAERPVEWGTPYKSRHANDPGKL